MSFGGLVFRILVQALLCGVTVAFLGGSVLWMVFFLVGGPAFLLSGFVFAPLEHIASRYGYRWVALAATPIVGAGCPWILYFQAPNKQNFLVGAPMLSIGFAVFGAFWILASLTALFFSQPPSPDPRLLG